VINKIIFKASNCNAWLPKLENQLLFEINLDAYYKIVYISGSIFDQSSISNKILLTNKTALLRI
jgi:hypothetical protein